MDNELLLTNDIEIRRRNNLIGRIAKAWQLYLLLFVPLVYLIVFKYIPMYGVQIAFKNYNVNLGIMGSEWVGLKYFLKFFSNYQFTRLIRNTLIISFYSLIAGLPVSVIIALTLNCVKVEKFKKLVQTVTYLPHFISVVVLVGMMYQIFNPIIGTYGNVYRILFGKEAPNIMGIPESFFHMYVWSGVWQNMGWDSIIYLAALSAVDTELYESAKIDGASRLKIMLAIDLPSIMPTVIIMLILRCGHFMNIGYEKILLMQNSFNLNYSEVIQTYVYKVGLKLNGDYSYATAIGLFNSVINLILITVVNKVSKKVGDTSLW